MIGFVVRRLLSAIPVLFLMSLVVFVVVHVLPGDPARALAGPDADATYYERARVALNLDAPLYEQYGNWIYHAAQGDLGESIRVGEPVSSLVAERFPLTLQLTLMATLIAAAVSFPLGVVAGIRRNSAADRAASMLAASGIAIPGFWLGLILISIFSVKLGWFRSFGFVPFTDDPVASIRSLILPAISLAMPSIAILTRMIRSAVIEVTSQDYVRTARAKGLAGRTVATRHVLRNALIPVTTVAGLAVGHMLGGSIIIEVVFGLPGLGRLAVDAILFRDLVTVQGVVLLVATVTVLVNLAVDLSYGMIDPRVKAARR